MEKCCERKTVRPTKDKRAIIGRLNRLSGQINGVKNMVEADKYCDDILIQLSAINKSVKSLANFIVEKHMYNCVLEDIKAGKTEILSEVAALFKRFQ